MSKNIKTRIQHKHDLEANWLRASGFVPLKGELIIYDAETQDTFNTAYAALSAELKDELGRTTPITHVRVKVGDGDRTVKELEFVDAHIIETISNIENSYATKDELLSNISELEIPNALADLSADEKHRTVTDTEKATWNAKSSFSGDYNDLTNKPTIPSINGLATESYADAAATKIKNDLLNGAGDAYDTLKELGDLIDENVDAIDALESVATSKADKIHTHPELISSGTADPDTSITSQVYFKYATE